MSIEKSPVLARRMLMLRRALPCLLLALPLLAAGEAKAPEQVSVKVVNYAGLGDTIKQLRGKVIVVDFWADY
jgi:hypothetical protein